MTLAVAAGAKRLSRARLSAIEEHIVVANVQELLEAARSLPPDKQLELLQGLAQSLSLTSSPLASASVEFGARRTLDELAQQQGVTAAYDTDALAMPDWSEDESAADLITFLREQRHTGR